MIKITEHDVGRLVLLKNNIKGKITVFDDSTMPVFVKHNPVKGSITNGTWHYTNGKYSNRNMQDFDIISFVEDFNIDRQLNRDNCNHEWQYYLGLSQQFYYCKICDKKKENI